MVKDENISFDIIISINFNAFQNNVGQVGYKQYKREGTIDEKDVY
ncbi:hypothetical protein CLOSAC_09890 [Clostridium saccharobutylicum]|uniref:Uncharacterized protein n=1 Tax=Clostridium saccharobutylicum TaxID=169679 RepID=A0A1S8NJT2_CLOSA|nr:hypothetical protein CLOSAC_09890 [Clostridium saccharobutylicum]